MYQPYRFYVINSLTHAILAGADHKEDALELAEDLPPGYIVKVFSRAYCIRKGIDLSDANWSNGTGDDLRFDSWNPKV